MRWHHLTASVRPGSRVALAILASLGLVAAACGDDDDTAAGDGGGAESASASEDCRNTSDPAWAETVEEAESEGQVVFYSATPPPVIDRLVEGFNEIYPDIAVEHTRGPSGELITRIDQERESGVTGADVFVTTEELYLEERAAGGDLLAMEGPSVAAFPADYRVGDDILIGGVEPLTIVYNTTLVTDPPESYEDLLAPEYEGKLGSSELAATTVVAWYDWVNETNGGDFMERLAAQHPRFYVGAVPNAQAVASGEVSATVFGNISATKPLMDEGAPIEYVVPDPAFGFAYSAAGLSAAGNPAAAQVFLDYLASPCGQEAWHGTGETASPLGVEGSLPIDTVQPYNPSDYPEATVDTFTAEWNQIFGR